MTARARELRSYQAEAVAAVEADWQAGVNRTAVVLPTGAGKPLHDDTEIPTVAGFVRMGDLRVGNYVIGSDGAPTRVVAVDPQGVIPLYRVEFDDHTSLLAGAGHLWTVQRKGRKARAVTTEWLMRQPMIDGDGYLWRIPVAAPAQFMHRGLPLDPYLAGSLIANGHTVHGRAAKLTTPDLGVVDQIRRRGIDIQETYTEEGACAAYTFPGLAHAITRAGLRGSLAGNKRIPEHFKVADVASRLDLLRGLMDADGSTRAGGRRSVLYHTTSELLAEDVAEVAWSLGARASVGKTDRTHDDKPVEYAVHILPPVGVDIFSTARKVRSEQPRRTFAPRRSIVSITPAGTGPATCIQVENSDGLFAAGRRYVMTHNSTVIAQLAINAYRRGQRVALLAHRAELLDQMCTSVLQVDLDIPLSHVGIVRAQRNDADAPIIAATLQTLSKIKRLQAVGRRDVILLDEAHHGAADGFYRTLGDLGAHSGGYLCGFTATMHRDGKASIGLGDLFDNIAFERDLMWAIDEGYLVTPRGLTVHTDKLDALASTRTVAGDYHKGQLAEIMEAAADCVAAAVLEYARDRRSIIFAASVDAAHAMADMLTAMGHPTGVITGAMSYESRQPVYEAFRGGQLRALTTVGVLTEGADFPMCDCVVLARPTKSMNLYSQMVGRAIRLHPGKTDALVLDLSGAGRQAICLTDLAEGVPARDVAEDGHDMDASEFEPEEIAPRPAPPEKPVRRGAVTVREFELLPKRAAGKYRRTEGGILFASVRGDRRTVFLAQDGDGWRVGHANTRTGQVCLAGEVLSFQQADELVRVVAESTGFDGLRARNRSDRPATDKQISFAAQMGIEAAGMSVAEVSEAIDTALAGRILDQRVPKLLEQQQAS